MVFGRLLPGYGISIMGNYEILYVDVVSSETPKRIRWNALFTCSDGRVEACENGWELDERDGAHSPKAAASLARAVTDDDFFAAATMDMTRALAEYEARTPTARRIG